MVNMETLRNASRLRERYLHISVVIHLNVTTGIPICDPKETSSLVDKNGVFWSIREFKSKYKNIKINSKELEKELEAQYSLFKKHCGQADYWNTHENSALQIKDFKVFEKVALKHNVKATRTFQRVYFDKINLGFKRSIREFFVKNFFNVWFSQIRKNF